MEKLARTSVLPALLASLSSVAAFAQTPALDSPATTVTLVTGDRVALRYTADGRPLVTFDPARAKSGGGYQTLAIGSHVFVVPLTAAGAPATQLDLSAFDVTALAGVTPSLVPPGQPAGKLYTLTVKGFDRKGQRVTGAFGVVYNVDDGNAYFGAQAFFNGTFSASVPAGNYQVSSLISTDDGSVTFATIEVAVKTSTVVVLDAKKGTRLSVTVPDPTSPVLQNVTLQRNAATGPSFTNGFTSFGPTPVYATPSRPVSVGQQYFYPAYRLGGPDGSVDKYVYDLRLAYVGGIPDSLGAAFKRTDFAVIDATYHSSSPGRNETDGRLALAPWQADASFSTTGLNAPLSRTEYLLPLSDAQWLTIVVADAQDFAGFYTSDWSSPLAGSRTSADWLAQPQPPGIEQEGPGVAQSCPACRSGDTLSTTFFPFVDPAGHRSLSEPAFDTTMLSLYSGGVLLGQQPASIAQFTLSPSPATYQLVLDLSRDAGWWPATMRTHSVWTFASAERAPDTLPAGWTCGGKGGGGGGGGKGGAAAKGGGGGGGGGSDGCSFEPLLFARYDTHAGADDVVAAGSMATIDVTVQRQAYAPRSPIVAFTLDVSFDDGASWTEASVASTGEGQFRATIAQPPLAATTGFASLRLAATDADGSMLEQTITRAYPLAVPPPATGGGGGGGRGVAIRPCNTAVIAPYTQCMAVTADPSSLGVSAPVRGYGPFEIQSAYNLPAGAGAGKTVAIVDAYDDPNAEADLAVWRATFGLPPCTTANGCFRKVNQRGAEGPLPTPDPGWGLEISLDLQAVSAACPSCNILLVEADSPWVGDLGPGVDTAVALGADAVSNSYGSHGEFSGEEWFERYYKHAGVAIVVSSGDFGYGNGLPLVGGVSYPGSSQFVTSVGGTTLVRDGSARGWTETAWAGSTSGCSAYIHKPGWQKDPLCDKRTVADVAAVADPETGLAVYDTFGYRGWLVVGGTSLSSPLIAAVYAMSGNTGSVRYGVDPYRNAAAFFDVASGATGTCGGSYLCTGVPGYDGPTGLGTPNGVGGF